MVQMIEINVFRALPRPLPGIGGENDDETFHVSVFRVQNSKDSQRLLKFVLWLLFENENPYIFFMEFSFESVLRTQEKGGI